MNNPNRCAESKSVVPVRVASGGPTRKMLTSGYCFDDITSNLPQLTCCQFALKIRHTMKSYWPGLWSATSQAGWQFTSSNAAHFLPVCSLKESLWHLSILDTCKYYLFSSSVSRSGSHSLGPRHLQNDQVLSNGRGMRETPKIDSEDPYQTQG